MPATAPLRPRLESVSDWGYTLAVSAHRLPRIKSRPNQSKRKRFFRCLSARHLGGGNNIVYLQGVFADYTATMTSQGAGAGVQSATLTERLAYDPWGKRRYVNGLSDNADSIVGGYTDRGFTLHQHLDEVGVVHMNGRVYDPLIGRFMSADPYIQAPGNLQSHNRYAYVWNNPLVYTDPSGYDVFSDAFDAAKGAVSDTWQGAVHFVTGVEAAVVNALPRDLRGPAVVVVSYWVCDGLPICTAAVSASINADVAYGNGASTSQALRVGVKSYVTATAFNWAGDVYAQDPGWGYTAHAGVGCASSVASGGGCAQGATSAVFGKYATVQSAEYWDVKPKEFNGGHYITTVVAGGVGSVIAGGKFENGATTAAYGYMFNWLGKRTGWGWLDRNTNPKDTSNCATAECKAGLLPTASENRSVDQIDKDLKTSVCSWTVGSVANSIAPSNIILKSIADKSGKVIGWVIEKTFDKMTADFSSKLSCGS